MRSLARADAAAPWARTRRWLRRLAPLGLLALVASCIPPAVELWDELLGPNEAQLVVIAEAPIRRLHVTYDGRAVPSRPHLLVDEVQGYVLFPALRTRALEPVLQVAWEAAGSPRSVSVAMRQFDSGRICLYVLRLDAAGEPVPPRPLDRHAPIWWTCHMH